jgi:hypothetical protein
MANDFWLLTAAELRGRCESKLLEAEKDFWQASSEMHQGMLESLWEAAKKGESVTLRYRGEKITLSKTERE